MTNEQSFSRSSTSLEAPGLSGCVLSATSKGLRKFEAALLIAPRLSDNPWRFRNPALQR